MSGAGPEVSPEGEPAGERARAAPAPLGSVVVLAIGLAIGLLAAVAPIVLDLVPGTDLPAPLADHNQDAETALYLLAFLAVMPLVAWLTPRVADRVSVAAGGAALSALVALLAAGLAAVLVLVRLTDGRVAGADVLAVTAAVWCVAAALGLTVAARGHLAPLLRTLARARRPLWIVAGALSLLAIASFSSRGSISGVVLAVGIAVTVAVVASSVRLRLPRLERRAGTAVDLAAVALILLAVPNLVVFGGPGVGGALETTITQFHQNFFLGPANQVLAGDALLVETLSQYGVGSIYFLAGLFTVIPIGNGTLGLIEGALSALMFAGGYVTIRIAGVGRAVAAAALAVAVVVLVWGLVFPLGALLQHGAFRFGLPLGVALGAVIEARRPDRAPQARALQLLTVAVASVWALEAFAYTLLTFAAVGGLRVLATSGRDRARTALRSGIAAASAVVVAHLTLAAATLAAAGELPDWGLYLTTLREFLTGPIGDLTYDFSSFSSGLALGGLYLASGIALLLCLHRRPGLLVREPALLVAIAAVTAWGVGLFSYLVNRSADHIVPYVSLPAVLLVALWLTLVGRPGLGVSAPRRRAGLGMTLLAASLLVAVAWSTVQTRAPHSALGHAVPGGRSLSAAVDRLWDPPPLKPEADGGERLLEAGMPGEERSIVLTSADLGVEILLRSGRGSAVPFGDPWEDSFVPDQHLDPLGRFVSGLEAGDRMLIDGPARNAFELYRRRPSLGPLAAPAGGVGIVPAGLATLQVWVLKEIGRDWDLRTLERGEGTLEVVELVPRRPGMSPPV